MAGTSTVGGYFVRRLRRLQVAAALIAAFAASVVA